MVSEASRNSAIQLRHSIIGTLEFCLSPILDLIFYSTLIIWNEHTHVR